MSAFRTESIGSVVNSLTTGIVVLRSDLRVDFLNSAAENLLGISNVRSYGRLLQDVVADPKLWEYCERSLNYHETHRVREISIRLIDMREIYVDLHVSPLHTDTDIRGVLIEFTSIDHQFRIARADQMEEQQKAIHELVRGMAHEIKNPLGGVRGAAQLLELELDDPELREYTGIIIAEADRLKNLINRMLLPNGEPEISLVNIHEILEYVRNVVSADKPEGIVFHHDYDPSIPEFLGCRDQLVQVVMNVIGNAIRALDGKGNITLKNPGRSPLPASAGSSITLKVDIIDDGPGIPEDIRDTLFLPMISGYADGNGLGLAIAQSLMSAHKGVIKFESEEGRTCFTLLIPMEFEK